MQQLSVIIVNHNTFSLTCKCIESIIRHTQGVEYEIILVDNASTECAPDRFVEIFPSIKLIKSPKNVGFAKGNNLGLAQARGKYILLMNSDTELVENSIAICLQKIQYNPAVGVVSPRLIYPDGRPQPVANRFHDIGYEIIELFRLHKIMGSKKLLGFHFAHDEEVLADWVWGAFFLTKREVIDKMPQKRLPDTFFMYFEDVQWCYIIKKKLGYQILFTPDTSVIHHVSASSSTNPTAGYSKIQYSLQNETHFWLTEKGRLYTRILYTLRATKYLSLRKKIFRQMAAVLYEHAIKL